MERTLLTMTDKVLEIQKEFENPSKPFDKNANFEEILAYANFLKRPLELGFFVPCENGDALNKKMIYATDDKDYIFESNEFDIYQQAKERMLFEGCVYDEKMEIVRSQDGENLCYIPQKELWKIEDLVKYNLTLSPSAIQQLKLK